MSSTIKTITKQLFEINKSKTNNVSQNDQVLIGTKENKKVFNPLNSLSCNNPRLYSHFVNLVTSQESIENYTNIQKNIIPTRGNIIDWLLVVADKIKIQQETFFKAIMIFDKYLSQLRTEIEDTNKLHFIAVVCFFISYKFEETGVMTLDFVEEKLLRSKYTKKEIVKQEMEILIALNFRINFPSVNTFSNIIIEALKGLYKESNVEQNPLKKANFISKLECIFNFVNKISLFGDEFIFGTYGITITLINFQTTLMLVKDMKIISEESIKDIDTYIKELVKEFVNQKKVEIMASGLYLAIMNQEKQGCHQNIFQSYYNNIEKIFKQEMVKSF